MLIAIGSASRKNQDWSQVCLSLFFFYSTYLLSLERKLKSTPQITDLLWSDISAWVICPESDLKLTTTEVYSCDSSLDNAVFIIPKTENTPWVKTPWRYCSVRPLQGVSWSCDADSVYYFVKLVELARFLILLNNICQSLSSRVGLKFLRPLWECEKPWNV